MENELQQRMKELLERFQDIGQYGSYNLTPEEIDDLCQFISLFVE